MTGCFKKRPGTEGFSLIEVLVVIVLWGIVLSAVSPLTTGILTPSQLNSTVNQIVADLRYIQMEAILNNRDYRMEIYPDGRYILYYTEPEKIVIKEGTYSKKLTLWKKKSGTMIEVEEKVKMGFNELGHSSYAGTIAFSGNDRMVKIIVSTWMGRIRIERG